MKFIYEWGIPIAVFLVWVSFIFSGVPRLVNFLKKKAEQSQNAFNETIEAVLSRKNTF